MTSMTGGEAIVSGLVVHGVDTVFGLPGAQVYGLFDAFQEMLSGRRGPVALEMPWDVFTQVVEVGPSRPFDLFPPPQPDPDHIKRAAALVAASKAPMIFVGSGAIHGREEILELAEMID